METTVICVHKVDRDAMKVLQARATADLYARGLLTSGKSARQPDIFHWLLLMVNELKTNTPLSHASSATVAGLSDQTV